MNLKAYLSRLYGAPAEVISEKAIGAHDAREAKSFGYGKPMLIQFRVNQKSYSAVLETMSENSFGHDHFSDRAQNLLWQHSTYHRLPHHVKSIDVGAFTPEKEMISLGLAEEFFLLAEFAEGRPYSDDLQRIYDSGHATELDENRAVVLAKYLADIHQQKKDAPHLYVRRIRDLIGHGECIMGLIDNYPANDPLMTPECLQQLENLCVSWRWKLKQQVRRLCVVHGDYHPWNILFRVGTDFTILDRSRGEWGEAADDLSSMLINYAFFSLRKYGKLQDPFEGIYRAFWKTYMDATRDGQIFQLIQPFFAWRALVLNHPVWYPRLPLNVRQKLLRFTRTVLELSEFRPEEINEYFG